MASTTRIAAMGAAVGLVGMAIFQIFLALGVPWGKAAWGGAHSQLPSALRVGSGLAAIVLVAAAFVVLGCAGHWGFTGAFGIFRTGTWVLVAVLAVSALGNFASSSRWENFLMGPIALLLALLCLVVAWNPARLASPK